MNSSIIAPPSKKQHVAAALFPSRITHFDSDSEEERAASARLESGEGRHLEDGLKSQASAAVDHVSQRHLHAVLQAHDRYFNELRDQDGYQTRDLLEAMRADWQGEAERATLRVDGGMSASDWTMQFLADITGAPVDRPQVLETTAMGAAWLAGQRAGIYPGMEEFAEGWALERQFEPAMEDDLRKGKYAAWKRAVEAAQKF